MDASFSLSGAIKGGYKGFQLAQRQSAQVLSESKVAIGDTFHRSDLNPLAKMGLAAGQVLHGASSCLIRGSTLVRLHADLGGTEASWNQFCASKESGVAAKSGSLAHWDALAGATVVGTALIGFAAAGAVAQQINRRHQ